MENTDKQNCNLRSKEVIYRQMNPGAMPWYFSSIYIYISPLIIYSMFRRGVLPIYTLQRDKPYRFLDRLLMGSLFFWSHSILFTLWLKRVEKHFKPGATPWYFLVYILKDTIMHFLGPFDIIKGPFLQEETWELGPKTSRDRF